jgi:hypothetical protein
MKRLLLLILVFLPLVLLAQDSLTVITGRVLNRENHERLAHVSVASPDGKHLTVTNDDGEFLLKVPGQRPAYVELTHLGFHSQRFKLKAKTQDLRIELKPSEIMLGEVVVMMDDPLEVVRAAIAKIPHNYDTKPSLLHCFYRETAQKGRRFIAVSEAVTDMYKTSYNYGTYGDAVRILKGRRLMSMRAKDTLGVKVMGGPVVPIMLDVVKNSELLFNEKELAYYELKLEMPERIDLRPQIVISFKPLYRLNRPLFHGRLLIDRETLAFTRIELQLDTSDRLLAADYMLVRRPAGLKFNPKELSTVINYRTAPDGKTRLSYVRNTMRFKCDWKRRLFSSAYTVVTEMVVTSVADPSEVSPIRVRDSFSRHDKFYDKVAFFDEPDFWGDYNIISPTESLEEAIERLKKK